MYVHVGLNSEVGILKEGLSESREENTLLRREAEQLKVSNNQLQKQTRESQVCLYTILVKSIFIVSVEINLVFIVISTSMFG